MKRSKFLGALLGILTLGTGFFAIPASAAIPAVGVKTTSLDEFAPSAGMDAGSGASSFAWSQNSEAKPNHYNAYLDINDGSTITRTRLNASGTFGWGAGIDGTTLVFQEVPSDTGNSDLVLYDIPSATRLPAPSGLNNRFWQWGPTMSGDWILYGENSRGRHFSRVMLHNASTGEERTLAESTFTAFNVWQGQVSGDYAVYYKTSTWNAFIYQISTGDTTKVPNPNDRPTYTPAVTADGTVYYARSANGCGKHVRIYRWSVVTPADPPVLLTELPDGKEISQRLYAFNDGTSTTVYFDRFRCRGGASNIYRLDNAETATAATPAFVGPAGAAVTKGTIPPGARAEET